MAFSVIALVIILTLALELRIAIILNFPLIKALTLAIYIIILSASSSGI